MDLARHIDRSQRCLNWVPVNLAAGHADHASGHAVTTAAIH